MELNERNNILLYEKTDRENIKLEERRMTEFKAEMGIKTSYCRAKLHGYT